MDGVPEAAAADPSARTYSQVVFMDIPQSYPPSAPITCCYTLNAAFKPQSRDWVGIFKVGWSTTRDYCTFVWVEPSQDVEGQQMVRHAVFKEYYLPKDEIEFYQFCYIDSTGQVRGASTPFCFRNPAEQSLESSPDDDLLVITTQDQVEQSQREKTELQKELQQLRAENETLKSILEKEQKQIMSFKDQNEQRKSEKTDLVKEMDQIREDNEKLKSMLLQQQKENDRLKEELMIQMAKQMEIQERNVPEQEKQSQSLKSLKTDEEKYDRALAKISQLKEQREELKKKIEAQSEEIERLKAKVREGERELLKTADSIPLLQIDLQNSEKEKDRLVAGLQSLADGMDEVKKENRELCRRLSQQETVQVPPADNLKVQCQTLSRQLQETQKSLSAEKEESRIVRRGAEILKRELQNVSEQLATLVASYDQEQRKSSKFEMQLRDMNEAMADRHILIQEKVQEIILMTQEKEQLTKENKALRDDIEGLRRVCTNLNTASAESEYMQPDILSPPDNTSPPRDQLETQQLAENLYETIGGVEEQEESLVCRHCQESFPGITRNELEQHEQSHRVCPFCTMICDNMEQSIFEDHVYGHEL